MTGKKIPDRYNDVGFGWHGLLSAMHLELMRISEDYISLQVKEKFGGLRAYVTLPEGIDPAAITKRREMYAVEARYEALSQSICEFCGQLGENKPVRSWYKTLCAFHREEAEKGK